MNTTQARYTVYVFPNCVKVVSKPSFSTGFFAIAPHKKIGSGQGTGTSILWVHLRSDTGDGQCIQYSGSLVPKAKHKERGRVTRAAVSNFSLSWKWTRAPLFLGLIEFLLPLKWLGELSDSNCRWKRHVVKRSGLFLSVVLTMTISLFDVRFLVKKCSSWLWRLLL